MMSNVNDEDLTWMNLFQAVINEVAEEHLWELSPEKLSAAYSLFTRWKRERNKLKVRHYYEEEGWRALYSVNLFKARIMTVLRSLDEIRRRRPEVDRYLHLVKSCVSIGCGPGPDIAAILIFFRSIGVRHALTIWGFDQYGEWSRYVDSLNAVPMDGPTHRIEFRRVLVDDTTIEYLPKADLCIMSYTDATGHSNDLWSQLKLKYAFIIILDQRNPALEETLLEHGYDILSYDCKGKKWLFYRWNSTKATIYYRNYESHNDANCSEGYRTVRMWSARNRRNRKRRINRCNGAVSRLRKVKGGIKKTK